MTGLSIAIRTTLAKMLGLLGSDHAGERDAAGLAAHRLVTNAGLTWYDVLVGPSEPVEVSHNRPDTTWRPPPSNAGPQRQPDQRQRRKRAAGEKGEKTKPKSPPKPWDRGEWRPVARDCLRSKDALTPHEKTWIKRLLEACCDTPSKSEFEALQEIADRVLQGEAA